MNKQALSSLTVQQLRQCKQNLARRIDDLKFFNLDLGRTNISLSEEYRQLRQKADKVKTGKMPKLTKAVGYRKNIYLYEPKPQSQNISQTTHQVNRNNFNFNDLYKLGKSKISSWIGGKGKKHEEIQLPNEQPYNHQNYLNQNYGHQDVVYYQQVIVGDFPPAEVMRNEEERDPLEQDVVFIVRQLPVIKTIDCGDKDPIEQEIIQIVRQSYPQEQFQQQQHYHQNPQTLNQPHKTPYQRLYRPQQDSQYIYQQQQRQFQEQQRYMMSQHNQHAQYQMQEKEYQKVQQPQLKKQNKNPTMKNFQFDDLPGIGWKKLKGLIGWGSKSKKEQQGKPYQAPVHQQQGSYTNPHNNVVTQVHQSTINPNNVPNQRKRTPIFGSGINSRESQQQEEDQSMKQARIQKQLEREEKIEKEVVVKKQLSDRKEQVQLGVESRVVQSAQEKQQMKIETQQTQ